MPSTSSHAELRRAYVSLARRYHPDFHIDDPPPERERTAALMRGINDAWAVLGDSDRRMAYDRSLNGSLGTDGTPLRTPREPEAASGHTPARWMQLGPALLLVTSFVLFALGFVTGLIGVLAAGLACAVLGGGAFVVVPMVTAMRSRGDVRPAPPAGAASRHS